MLKKVARGSAARPGICNGWGDAQARNGQVPGRGFAFPGLRWLLTVPLIAWLSAWRAQTEQRPLSELAIGFACGLILGIVVAVMFRADLQDYILYVLGAATLLGLALPAYRLECILGFFLGMMFVFGGVLPLIPALPIVLVSFVCRVVLWRGILKRRESA